MTRLRSPRAGRAGGSLAGVALALASMLLAGCGVPIDRTATVTPDDDVPYDLLSSTTTSQPPATPEGGETTICLSVNGQLLSLGRDRAGDPPLLTLEALATAGPTEGEASLGLRSAVRGEDVIGDVTQLDGEAVVTLGPSFAELAADQQLLAVAQLTCTLTGQPSVAAVVFELDGEAIEVPVDSGELVDRAVERSDYLRLIAN